jgi:hypothetical protein
MNERKHLCVYTHSTNGKVFYVGQGRPRRAYDRWCRNRRWLDHVKMVGDYETTIHAWTDDRSEAQRVESEMIAAHDPPCNVRKIDIRKYPISRDPLPQLMIRIAPAMIARIDDWRRVQTDLPNRAETVRRLVEIGLTSKPKIEKRK